MSNSVGPLSEVTVSAIGLCIFTPDEYQLHDPHRALLGGRQTWIPFDLDRSGFLREIRRMLTVLASPTPPPPHPTCTWCNYRGGSFGTPLPGWRADKTWKLSPSLMTFLWKQCRMCWYLKVVAGIDQPSIPVPGIFMAIDREMSQRFHGGSTAAIDPSLPEGIVRRGRFLKSRPIHFEDISCSAFVSGRTDGLFGFANGSWGVPDWKTAGTNEKDWAIYGNQLHAYAYALERPLLDHGSALAA